MELIYEDIVQASDRNERIDKYLAKSLHHYTRSFIQKLIKDKMVTVNDQYIKANYKISGNDKIIVKIPKAAELAILPENIPLDVLYEDSDLMIVNKEQGMVVHPAPGHQNGTLVNALLYAYPGQLSTIKGEIRPGIVHRIDKDTSGVLMIAKNDKTHKKLEDMLQKHLVERKYHAIVYGNFHELEGFVEEPIGRHPTYRIKRIVTDQNARYARTDYKVLQQFEGFSYLELSLTTGRTHQIRVHMEHIKHPVIGDPIYGPTKQPFGLKGQRLHAKMLGFNHPRTGEYMEIESPLPLYFEKTMDRLIKEYPLR